MKKTLYIAIAFAALFAVSCQKEKELHPVGSRIVFSAATEFMNTHETRTIYTGEYTQTTPNNYERIQWVANDPITILYSHGTSTSANYTIDGNISGSGTAKKSTASISASGAALEWAGGSSHVFYGLYPTGAGTLSAGSVTGLVMPATQTVTWNADQSKYLPTMTNAFMVAYKDMSNDQNSTVNLPFTPIVNAIEFRLHLPDDRPSYTVTQVKFSHASTAIAGTYNVDITGFANDAVTWSIPNNGISNPATGIIVNFSPANPAVPTSTSGSVLDFTVLTLPVSISDPILQIKYSDGHVLKLTLTGLSLQPGQKCIVTNSKAGHDDFTYEVSNPSNQTITGHTAASFSQINVSSIKRSGADNTHTEPVGWKVQYNDNGTWRDGVPSGYTLSDDHTNNRFTVSLNTDNSSTTAFASGNPYQAATEILRARSALTGTNDLSCLSATGSAISQTSANCYVVTRAGTYRIPLIYGNARVLGQNNSSAYNPSGISGLSPASSSGDTNQSYFLPTFYNAAGVGITSPYILTDLGNVGTVSGLSAQVSSLSQTPCISTSDLSVGGSGSNAYIQFTISQSSIQPGNILIDLKGTVGSRISNKVLWSWHIWVTDKDLTPDSSDLMPYNLGWVDANTTVSNSVSRYTNRTVQLRIAQVEGGSEVNSYSDPFTLTQNGDAAAVNNPSDGDKNKGTNPHYQWGRKDPFPMSNSTITLTQRSDVLSTYDYGKGIREPNTMFKGEKSTTWIDGKAIPLYKDNPTSHWEIQSGAEYYGPFSTSEKNSVSAITTFNTGATWTERMTTPEIVSYTVKSTSSANTLSANTVNYMVNVAYWFTGDYFHAVSGGRYYMEPGKVFSLSQHVLFENIVAGGDNTNNIWYNAFGAVDWYNIQAILNNQLQANYSTPTGTGQWDVSFSGGYPYGPYTQSEANTLAQTGHWTTGTTIIQITNHSYSYTSDSDRNVGSILCNLWSGSLYRENASLPSGGKYKTVYDPCPAGFTVPTVATYLEGSSLGSLSNKAKTGITTFTSYPRTGNRMNGSSGNEPINWNSNNTSCGFYWSDHACSMEWITSDPDKSSIDSYRYQTDAYMLHTMENTCSLTHFTRGTAASIRPMVDPRAIGASASASPVNSNNSIESVTNGSSLY